MSLIEKLTGACRGNPQRIVFAEANDHRIVKAARFLKDNQLARPILIGGNFEIRETADQINVSSRGLEIINHRHHRQYDPLIQQLAKKNHYKGLKREEIEVLFNDPLYFALTYLNYDKADVVLAGNSSTMKKVAGTTLQLIDVCSQCKRASSFYMLFSKANDVVFAFADCSLNINPSAETMAETAIQTAQKFSRVSNQVPRLAFLSFSTKGSAQPQNIDKIKEAVAIVNRDAPTLICDGEVQFDAAIDSAVAQRKGANNILNGKANVFIFPSLNSANIAQKIAEHVAGLLSIGPMIQGLQRAVHHLPKSCTVESIINSALLASFLKSKTNP